MNRQQRRKQQKSAPKKNQFHKLSKQERIERIQQNGITISDLKNNYDTGFNNGYKTAGEDAIKACYAAMCLALHELYGFGEKRCRDVLKYVDDAVLYRITGEDMVKEVFDKINLKIAFSDPIERIQSDE